MLTTASGRVEGKQVPSNSTQVAAYIIAAIAPVMRLYAHIADMILTYLQRDATKEPYRKWLEYYRSEEIEDIAQKNEDLLGILCTPLTEEELEITERLCHKAIKLHVEFLASQPMFQRTVVPLFSLQDPNMTQLTIFSNFDMTCSVDHYHAMLGQIAIATSTSSQPPEDLGNEFDVISNQYREGYERCMESISSCAPGKENEFDYDRLKNALEKFVEFEKKTHAKLEESGILKGLSLDGIKKAGQESLILSDGCREFFKMIVKNKNPSLDVHVISYCLSDDLIRSAFSSDLEALNIHSNDLVYNEYSVTTGEIVKKLESPFDKFKTFKKILEEYKE
ncbi:heme oxygenase [Trema orientale]|uniref:Heme oxygenase n=1 Tax=Trema orientale TaxID=63057 RepID=A0A2P5C0Q8_TREOI|nr:heme oxygenase [Trema orientale]